MTIPALIQEYQTRQYATANKVFQGKFQEALKVMNTQQVLKGYNSTESFVNELTRHYSIFKVCDTNPTECFPENIIWNDKDVDMTTKLNSSDIVDSDENWNTKLVGLEFANGMSAILAYNPKCDADPYDAQADVAKCVAVVYDTNSHGNPNTLGKDVNRLGPVKELAKDCFVEGGKNLCLSAPIQPTSLTYNECLAKKDEYGIPVCCPKSSCSDKDLWAGAIVACGGIDNVPTLEELAELSKGLYTGNTDSFKADLSIGYGVHPPKYSADYNPNSEIAKSLGFEPPIRLLSANIKEGDLSRGQYSFWAMYLGTNYVQQWSYALWFNADIKVMCKNQ